MTEENVLVEHLVTAFKMHANLISVKSIRIYNNDGMRTGIFSVPIDPYGQEYCGRRKSQRGICGGTG